MSYFQQDLNANVMFTFCQAISTSTVILKLFWFGINFTGGLLQLFTIYYLHRGEKMLKPKAF